MEDVLLRAQPFDVGASLKDATCNISESGTGKPAGLSDQPGNPNQWQNYETVFTNAKAGTVCCWAPFGFLGT